MAHGKESSPSAPQPRPARALNAAGFLRKPWFAPLLLLVTAILYFSPYLSFDKALVGSDDGARGWNTFRNYGHAITSFADIWSPINGGTAMVERRFGRFISPMYPLHWVMPKYQQRTIEYIFWTFVAGALMLWYLLEVGIRRGVATVLAMGFMLAPALLSNVFTGHYVKMEVIALMPGVMAFVERMLRKASLIDVAGLPALLALAIYSEHLQLAYFLFFGMGLYFAARMLYDVLKKRTSFVQGVVRTSYFAGALVIGALITSMNSLPSIHHAEKVSKRAGGVDYAYASSFSLHPEEVMTFVEPDFVGWAQYYWGRNPLKLNSEYFGVLIVLLAILLFVMRKQSFDRWLLAIMAFGALLFALGAETPVHRIIYSLAPGMKNFRAPSMAYIWIYFPCFVLAAYALQELLTLDWRGDAKLRKRLLIFGGIAGGLAVVYMFGSKAIAEGWYRSVLPVDMQDKGKFQALEAHLPALTVGGVFVGLTVAGFLAAAWARLTGRLGTRTFLIILAALLIIDMARISYPFMTQCAKPHNFFARQEAWERSVGDFITKQDKGLFRVHAMLGDQKMYIPGLDLTYIFDDFTDQQYNDVIQQVMMYSQAIQRQEYASNPSVQAQFRNMLSFLNAKYILSPGPLPVPGFTELINSGGFRIYRNEVSFPRLYLAPQIVRTEDPKKDLFDRFASMDFTPVFATIDAAERVDLPADTIRDSTIADRVDVETHDARMGRIRARVSSSRPQMLVVTENDAPGWTATLNGAATPVLEVNYAWKGVLVPRGASMVELVYDSPIARKWRGVTAVSAIAYGLFALAVLGLSLRRKEKKSA